MAKNKIFAILFLLFLNMNLVSFSIAQTLPSVDPAKQNNAQQSFESLFNKYQTYLDNIAAHEPIYFLVGTNPKKSKFQFSFKYQLFNADSNLVQTLPFTNGINFAYTQTSFWDLKSESKPFQDTSYKPELFFQSSTIAGSDNSNSYLFINSGIQHESNGKAGDDSRSTNRAYVKPILVFLDKEHLIGLQIAPKIWAYIENDDDTNPNLENYRGYFDLEVTCGKADKLVLESHFRYAKKGGSWTADLTYPMSNFRFSKNLDLHFHVQYVNALAENLLDYRQRTHAVRIGFSLIR